MYSLTDAFKNPNIFNFTYFIPKAICVMYSFYIKPIRDVLRSKSYITVRVFLFILVNSLMMAVWPKHVADR
jgi:hypothetical protein